MKRVAIIECATCKKEVKITNMHKSPLQMAKKNGFFLISMTDLKEDYQTEIFVCKDCFYKHFYKYFFRDELENDV